MICFTAIKMVLKFYWALSNIKYPEVFFFSITLNFDAIKLRNTVLSNGRRQITSYLHEVDKPAAH